jgi:hypothetical protein
LYISNHLVSWGKSYFYQGIYNFQSITELSLIVFCVDFSSILSMIFAMGDTMSFSVCHWGDISQVIGCGVGKSSDPGVMYLVLGITNFGRHGTWIGVVIFHYLNMLGTKSHSLTRSLWLSSIPTRSESAGAPCLYQGVKEC